MAAGLFNIERAGARSQCGCRNPTNVVEERKEWLDHGAVVTASGQAAMHLAVTTLLSAEDHIVSSRSLYGGTHNLLEYTLRFGISTTFVDHDPAAFAAAIQDNEIGVW